MRLRTLLGVAVLACAGCSHTSEHLVATAHVDGERHVVVRAEAGRIWWSHRAWTEPHELWRLPSRGPVSKLAVAREGDGFAVTFEQGGTAWTGRFGDGAQSRKLLATGRR